MLIKTYRDRKSLSRAAARHAGGLLRERQQQQDTVRLIAATGQSQFDFLEELTSEPDIEWSRVELFHLDEYVGLPLDHPASFRKYLLERLIDKVSIPRYHFLDAEKNPEAVAERVGHALSKAHVDVAFVGIGENGHLAFNDPPADFDTERPYIIVTLDDACRRQQAGEGWFATPADVPAQAISMSIRQILKAREIVAVVPDGRKAAAVRSCLEDEISPLRPASILRTHANTALYLDADSAALLSPSMRGEILE